MSERALMSCRMVGRISGKVRSFCFGSAPFGTGSCASALELSEEGGVKTEAGEGAGGEIVGGRGSEGVEEEGGAPVEERRKELAFCCASW